MEWKSFQKIWNEHNKKKFHLRIADHAEMLKFANFQCYWWKTNTYVGMTTTLISNCKCQLTFNKVNKIFQSTTTTTAKQCRMVVDGTTMQQMVEQITKIKSKRFLVHCYKWSLIESRQFPRLLLFIKANAVMFEFCVVNKIRRIANEARLRVLGCFSQNIINRIIASRAFRGTHIWPREGEVLQCCFSSFNWDIDKKLRRQQKAHPEHCSQ